jgi:enoyl-CoA hydratase/carnithine racemase
MFCAGADLMVADSERARVSRELYALYGEMVALPRPLVAALHGAAVGGGAQLAVACDLRIASPAASVRFVGPAHGLAVGAWALPSLVGRGRALDLCLTGRFVDAEEALSMGLIDRLAADPDAAAHELAARLASLDAGAVARVKAIVARAVADGPGPALAAESEGNARWTGRATDARADAPERTGRGDR